MGEGKMSFCGPCTAMVGCTYCIFVGSHTTFDRSKLLEEENTHE